MNGRKVGDLSLSASADDIISGYEQIIARAHAHGIKVIGATIMPYEGEGIDPDGHATLENAYTPAKEEMRETINRWIIGSDAFDGVLDFDTLMRDPAHPTRLLPAYDSGYHVHPNDTGTTAIANAICLSLFR